MELTKIDNDKKSALALSLDEDAKDIQLKTNPLHIFNPTEEQINFANLYFPE